ncbi:competence protein ComEC [Kushneria sinocarnis]|uniref:Competence protein ComEC n=1 Tax=Kushneria sinocarnis TaxID=595502 RepID=A0A420WYQ2_9GAMM|nr:DNA internalization-related competence protein ComEC/Rec2 [Kushneria sinocarnis]RKR06367.1 competence protein ComEC [Kushneria sinocarnis]
MKWHLPLLAMSAVAGGWLALKGYPAVAPLWMLLLMLALALRRWLLVGCLLVALLAGGHAIMAKPRLLADGLAGQEVRLTGRIVELETLQGRDRLALVVTSCHPLHHGLPKCEGLGRVRLNWYRPEPLAIGQHWQLTARLKPPHGYANPDSFDYRYWLIRQGFGATGYVRDAPRAVLQQAAHRPVGAWLDQQLKAHAPSGAARAWLAALTLGRSEALSGAQWQALADTGTSHLMVVSGLHVSLVAVWALLLCRGLSRLLQPTRWRMLDWPWLMAALTTFGYAALAGFGAPVLRAAIMTIIGLWVASGRHAPGVWQGWWLALVVVVLCQPLEIMSPGLWLSFGAVATLIMAWCRRPRGRGGMVLLRTQCLMALVTAVASLWAFDRLSLIALPVNLLAIPWVTMIMVPLGLLGWLLTPLPMLTDWLWQLFGLCADGFAQAITALASHFPAWQPAHWLKLPLMMVLGLLALCWLLPGLDLRWRIPASLSLLLVLPGLAPLASDSRHWSVVVHDIGQGELVEIRTAHSRWLYDTGPRFPSGFAPIMTLWQTPGHFDGVIVSHGDLDHAGGVRVLAERHDVGHWWAPTRHTMAVSGITPCRAGAAWRVDGITFRFLWPMADVTLPAEDNERSCILAITDGRHRVLLTGDADTAVERQLLAHLAAGPITLLVAGHHGSSSSSGSALINHLKPRHVIFSAGYLNRYHHPADAVVRRFHHARSCLWSTAVDGAVTLDLVRGGGGSIRGVRHHASDRMAVGGVEGGCAGVESAPLSGALHVGQRRTSETS